MKTLDCMCVEMLSCVSTVSVEMLGCKCNGPNLHNILIFDLN